jgi:hypothetical protein
MMPDAKDCSIEKVCPYCGAEYGGRLMCCGETHAHSVWVTDCPGLEEEQFDTEADCFRAIEDECREANIMSAELQGDLGYAERQMARGMK